MTIFCYASSMSMTCDRLQEIYQTSSINDGTSSCCSHSEEDQTYKTLVLYKKSCKNIFDLYESQDCCYKSPTQELDGFDPSCKKNRICVVNPPLGTGTVACTNRICQARTLA